ncbi:uncharacterized protein LOC143273377 [Peromyscus maniculatus bairdii]|uniref:uncharacterized protein LOC143273377 n=1 Tax=Peromyscus maniculatus bairdii TaxID=230844 RepID=UPI003FD5E2EA
MSLKKHIQEPSLQEKGAAPTPKARRRLACPKPRPHGNSVSAAVWKRHFQRQPPADGSLWQQGTPTPSAVGCAGAGGSEPQAAEVPPSPRSTPAARATRWRRE